MATPIKPIDFVKMLDEIKTIRNKYKIPRSIILVPDKLEVSVHRVSYDNFHLSYKEFFNYLPNQMLEIVIPITINFLVQMGIPKECIKRINENGVGMELDGNLFVIVGCILSELLIQRRLGEDELSSFLDTSKTYLKAFTDFSELEFEWNNEIEKKFYDNLINVYKIVQEYPSAMAEIEAIVKKYTQTKSAENL